MLVSQISCIPLLCGPVVAWLYVSIYLILSTILKSFQFCIAYFSHVLQIDYSEFFFPLYILSLC